MCSRFYRFKDLKELYVRFKIAEVLSQLGPQYNIAPTDMALVLPAGRPRIAKAMHFGIINPFMKSKPNLLINMRAESFSEKEYFRPWLLNRRCLVIADGFIEWQRKEIPGKKKTDNTPYRLDPKNHEPFGLAGTCDEDGFVVITTAPNPLVEQIHDRMPVILRREDEDAWLDPDLKDFGRLRTMLAPYPAGEMEKAAISKLASNSKNKQADILNPVSGR